MGSRRSAYRELEEALRSVTDNVSSMKIKIDATQKENDFLRRSVESLQRGLEYYENPNSLPSTDSLGWRRQRRERARQRKECRWNKEKRKPGYRVGHPGTSRKHSPRKRKRTTSPGEGSAKQFSPPAMRVRKPSQDERAKDARHRGRQDQNVRDQAHHGASALRVLRRRDRVT